MQKTLYPVLFHLSPTSSPTMTLPSKMHTKSNALSTTRSQSSTVSNIKKYHGGLEAGTGGNVYHMMNLVINRGFLYLSFSPGHSGSRRILCDAGTVHENGRGILAHLLRGRQILFRRNLQVSQADSESERPRRVPNDSRGEQSRSDQPAGTSSLSPHQATRLLS